jgi:ABC-2 type transport system permease protein
MFTDIVTVSQKELKEIMVQRGSMRGGLVNLLVILLIIGVMFPLQYGTLWITSPVSLLSTVWLPLLMSMGLIADSFAGERERNTLETLLASRLSDHAILFGKMAAAVIYAMGLAIVGALAGAITVNVAFPGTGFYPLPNLAAIIVFGLLGALLVSGMGVLVSLRADNVRQAYQRMSLGFLVLWLPLMLAPQFLPEEWQGRISVFLSGLNLMQLAIGVVIVMLILDAVLVAAAMGQFQRARLIAD